MKSIFLVYLTVAALAIPTASMAQESPRRASGSVEAIEKILKDAGDKAVEFTRDVPQRALNKVELYSKIAALSALHVALSRTILEKRIVGDGNLANLTSAGVTVVADFYAFKGLAYLSDKVIIGSSTKVIGESIRNSLAKNVLQIGVKSVRTVRAMVGTTLVLAGYITLLADVSGNVILVLGGYAIEDLEKLRSGTLEYLMNVEAELAALN